MRFIKFTILLFIVFIGSASMLHAADRTAARKELFDLLETRQKLFNSYDSTLKKKSGFFGNRTKNDMRESHATLQSIVDMDNRIMNSLERVIDTKNFEKTSLTFDQNTNQDRINNLLKVNDVTLQQNEKLAAENKQMKSETLRMKFYFLILFLMIAFLLYKLFYKK